MTLDPETIEALQAQRAEQLAREPSRPLDELAHIFAGEPGDEGYLGIVRDLLSEEPRAAAQAQLLWADPMLRDGLSAVLELFAATTSSAQPDRGLISDCVLRFGQGVVASDQLGPASKSQLTSDLQAALRLWISIGQQGQPKDQD